jgi:hypothetical protein
MYVLQRTQTRSPYRSQRSVVGFCKFAARTYPHLKPSVLCAEGLVNSGLLTSMALLSAQTGASARLPTCEGTPADWKLAQNSSRLIDVSYTVPRWSRTRGGETPVQRSCLAGLASTFAHVSECAITSRGLPQRPTAGGPRGLGECPCRTLDRGSRGSNLATRARQQRSVHPSSWNALYARRSLSLARQTRHSDSGSSGLSDLRCSDGTTTAKGEDDG